MNLLPVEILDRILKGLPFEDVLKTASVSKQFAEICRTWKFWGEKALQDHQFPRSLFNSATDIDPRYHYRMVRHCREHPNDALPIASHLNNLPLLRYLVNVAHANEFEVSLLRASSMGHLEVVKFLVEGAIPVNSPIDLVDSLVEAIEHHHMPVIKYLFTTITHREPHRRQDICETILYGGAWDGYFDIVQYARQKGALDVDGGLCASAAGNHLAITKFFIQAGATNFDGGLYTASNQGHLAMVEYLIQAGATNLNPSLVVASTQGRLDIVRLLVLHGATNLNLALIRATKCRNTLVVEYLLQAGATDIRPALLSAVAKGYHSIVRVIIRETYQKPNGLNAQNLGPFLYEASRKGHLLLVKFFVRLGSHGLWRSLRVATRRQHPEIVNYLTSIIESGIRR